MKWSCNNLQWCWKSEPTHLLKKGETVSELPCSCNSCSKGLLYCSFLGCQAKARTPYICNTKWQYVIFSLCDESAPEKNYLPLTPEASLSYLYFVHRHRINCCCCCCCCCVDSHPRSYKGTQTYRATPVWSLCGWISASAEQLAYLRLVLSDTIMCGLGLRAIHLLKSFHHL